MGVRRFTNNFFNHFKAMFSISKNFFDSTISKESSSPISQLFSQNSDQLTSIWQRSPASTSGYCESSGVITQSSTYTQWIKPATISFIIRKLSTHTILHNPARRSVVEPALSTRQMWQTRVISSLAATHKSLLVECSSYAPGSSRSSMPG